jgi:Holliday junction resolvasome RuvABC endonuclease subunit
MNVIGFDLSLTSTGIARIDGTTTRIRTAAKGSERIDYINQAVIAALDGADCAVIEGYSFGSKGAAVFQIGELGGVIRHTLWSHGTPFAVVPPTTLKKYACGTGVAKKPDMRMALYKRAGIDNQHDDEVDAWWLRHAGLDHYGFPEIVLPATHREALAKVEWPAFDHMEKTA